MPKTEELSPSLPWQVEMRDLHQLKPSPRNARTHSKKQIQQIADCIARFGHINPIIVDAENNIIAGHGRAAACKLMNRRTVPVICVTHLSETELRAYALADNKLALGAGWDAELLTVELEALQVALPELGIELDITGFTAGEVDLLLTNAREAEETAEELSDPPAAPASQPGDLFVLGKHRLIVGDARDAATYQRLMNGERATMAFLDAPYNRPADQIGGRGRVRHGAFRFASGEMSSQAFTAFLTESYMQCARVLQDGAIVYCCMDWRHIGEQLAAGAAAFDELKNLCVWAKTTPGQGSFYRSQHELIFVHKVGGGPHLNTFELGQHGRTRSNVWIYPGASSFRAGRLDELQMHPTVKPVALVADVMRDCSRRDSIVLDSFAGSGSTIMAAEQVGRRAYCIEIDPTYVDVAIMRWQRATGKDAILEETGATFDELAISRRRKASEHVSGQSRRKRRRTG